LVDQFQAGIDYHRQVWLIRKKLTKFVSSVCICKHAWFMQIVDYLHCLNIVKCMTK